MIELLIVVVGFYLTVGCIAAGVLWQQGVVKGREAWELIFLWPLLWFD